MIQLIIEYKFLNPNGKFIGMFGTKGSGSGEFKTPRSVAVLGNGRIVASEPLHPDTGVNIALTNEKRKPVMIGLLSDLVFLYFSGYVRYSRVVS